MQYGNVNVQRPGTSPNPGAGGWLRGLRVPKHHGGLSLNLTASALSSGPNTQILSRSSVPDQNLWARDSLQGGWAASEVEGIIYAGGSACPHPPSLDAWAQSLNSGGRKGRRGANG